MARDMDIPALLQSLAQSVESTAEIGPRISSIGKLDNGVSLLDVKNELLLSYLQNLVFFIILKLRQAGSRPNGELQDTDTLGNDVTKSLTQLRLYLEKGARPLEDKIRYQIEMLIRTADEIKHKEKPSARKRQVGFDATDVGEGSEGSDSENQEDEEHSDGEAAPRAKPRLSNFVQPALKRADGKDAQAGAYRPPKRERQVMETVDKRGKATRRPQKSATIDEFVATELSNAPLAEPSIGTTIVARGRRVKTATDRKQEAERRDYEETHFIRLPNETKKEKAHKAKQAGRSGRMEFGGEEWRDLGDRIDRIERLTQRKEGGAGVRAMLEKSRKRGADSIETSRGGNGDGSSLIGDRFQKRLKTLEQGRNRGKRKH